MAVRRADRSGFGNVAVTCNVPEKANGLPLTVICLFQFACSACGWPSYTGAATFNLPLTSLTKVAVFSIVTGAPDASFNGELNTSDSVVILPCWFSSFKEVRRFKPAKGCAFMTVLWSNRSSVSWVIRPIAVISSSLNCPPVKRKEVRAGAPTRDWALTTLVFRP